MFNLFLKYLSIIDFKMNNIIAGVYCNKTDLPDIPTSGYRVRHLPEPREQKSLNLVQVHNNYNFIFLFYFLSTSYDYRFMFYTMLECWVQEYHSIKNAVEGSPYNQTCNGKVVIVKYWQLEGLILVPTPLGNCWEDQIGKNFRFGH